MKLINNRIYNAIIILGFLFAGSNFNTNAGQKYELKEDRFTDKKTASYTIIPKTECKLTKSLKSRISSCFLINSTESSMYPSLNFGTLSKGWDLLSYSSIDTSNAIVTFYDGTIKKMAFPAKYSGDSIYGATVMEWVTLYLYDLEEDLAKITKLEFQFGSSEYEWLPDRELVRKVVNFEE
ncbi:hypothetical protein OA254_00465 [Prochlorococcus sp. AH-716-P05]|nr:hypothetical protein [Prochlorococcus sp. AH-716-P05]